jgi:hypothetical protein
MTADGAYDGQAIYDLVAERHPEAVVIIPPWATSVPNASTTTQSDRHIAEIEEHGRMGSQRRSGYNRRSLVETAMYRYKNRCRPAATDSDSAQSADRGKDWLQRAQPDDDARYAGHRPDPLIRATRRETQPAIYSCTPRQNAAAGEAPRGWLLLRCAGDCGFPDRHAFPAQRLVEREAVGTWCRSGVHPSMPS